MIVEGSDFVVREVPFPPGVHGAVKADPDGRANIYIRDKDPEEEKLRTFHHEMRHFLLGHLSDHVKPDEQKEREASTETLIFRRRQTT